MDPARIAAELRLIARGFADLAGSKGEDQPVELWRELPEYEPIVGWGVDVPGAGSVRKRFGNMILSRLAVGRVLRHSLPWPASPGVPSMPRVALEAVVQAPCGRLASIRIDADNRASEHQPVIVELR